MNKDVIYIDVDDDVTAIIGKIKKAKEKIVALVPPKRIGALQSAVNLRLIDRMAHNEKKKLVLITSNQALVALAASAQIPVAKNLQSKPELAAVPALIIDDGDDIIDGADLPVGDHAKTVKVKDGTLGNTIDTSTLDIDGVNAAVDSVATQAMGAAAKKGKNRIKIPNFDTFRKKLFLGIGGGILLVALLVWMFVFAPAATVIITASTTPVPVSSAVQLGGTRATNFEEGVVRSASQQNKVDETIEFDATGIGKVGDKATGEVVFRNCESDSSITVPAGTAVSVGGRNYITQAPATVSGARGFASCTTAGTSSPVGVVAQEVGSEYDVPTNTTFAVAGRASTSGPFYFRAVSSTAVDGGSSREVKVVSAADIERARGDLIGRSTDAQKKALAEKFTNDEIVIDSSFTVERGGAVSAPAEGQESGSGKATLTIPTTYTVQAVPEADLKTYLQEYLESQFEDNTNQKVYSTGIDDATVSNFQSEGETQTATINAAGSVGPEINEEQIKEEVKGKRYGEVQESLQLQPGVREVDVQFSYFWVRTVPGDPDKITIEFKVNDEQ